ncbi:universal stress protein [Cryobacterium fucosi]|nr:universal stress protein [Cryobacterium fucosi]
MNKRIVVGLSGRPTDEGAMRWALGYAAPRRLEVDLVHVVDETWGEIPAGFRGSARAQAETELARDVAEAVRREPGLVIHSTVLVGSPTSALAKRAAGAELLVVGSHALGRFRDYVFSTRAAQIAARAPGSVVVVPERTQSPGRGVVVGVDGSDLSLAAVRFAAEEADRHGEPLTAVYCWSAPTPWTAETAVIDWPMEPDDSDRLVLAEAVAGLAAQYPDLDLDLRLELGLPSETLARVAAGARLLVVGSHGRHGLQRFWLGSVSQVIVLTMPCPVAVIRPAPSEAASRAAESGATASGESSSA